MFPHLFTTWSWLFPVYNTAQNRFPTKQTIHRPAVAQLRLVQWSFAKFAYAKWSFAAKYPSSRIVRMTGNSNCTKTPDICPQVDLPRVVTSNKAVKTRLRIVSKGRSPSNSLDAGRCRTDDGLLPLVFDLNCCTLDCGLLPNILDSIDALGDLQHLEIAPLQHIVNDTEGCGQTSYLRSLFDPVYCLLLQLFNLILNWFSPQTTIADISLEPVPNCCESLFIDSFSFCPEFNLPNLKYFSYKGAKLDCFPPEFIQLFQRHNELRKVTMYLYLREIPHANQVQDIMDNLSLCPHLCELELSLDITSMKEWAAQQQQIIPISTSLFCKMHPDSIDFNQQFFPHLNHLLLMLPHQVKFYPIDSLTSLSVVSPDESTFPFKLHFFFTLANQNVVKDYQFKCPFLHLQLSDSVRKLTKINVNIDICCDSWRKDQLPLLINSSVQSISYKGPLASFCYSDFFDLFKKLHPKAEVELDVTLAPNINSRRSLPLPRQLEKFKFVSNQSTNLTNICSPSLISLDLANVDHFGFHFPNLEEFRVCLSLEFSAQHSIILSQQANEKLLASSIRRLIQSFNDCNEKMISPAVAGLVASLRKSPKLRTFELSFTFDVEDEPSASFFTCLFRALSERKHLENLTFRTQETDPNRLMLRKGRVVLYQNRFPSLKKFYWKLPYDFTFYPMDVFDCLQFHWNYFILKNETSSSGEMHVEIHSKASAPFQCERNVSNPVDLIVDWFCSLRELKQLANIRQVHFDRCFGRFDEFRADFMDWAASLPHLEKFTATPLSQMSLGRFLVKLVSTGPLTIEVGKAALDTTRMDDRLHQLVYRLMVRKVISSFTSPWTCREVESVQRGKKVSFCCPPVPNWFREKLSLCRNDPIWQKNQWKIDLI